MSPWGPLIHLPLGSFDSSPALVGRGVVSFCHGLARVGLLAHPDLKLHVPMDCGTATRRQLIAGEAALRAVRLYHLSVRSEPSADSLRRHPRLRCVAV